MPKKQAFPKGGPSRLPCPPGRDARIVTELSRLARAEGTRLRKCDAKGRCGAFSFDAAKFDAARCKRKTFKKEVHDARARVRRRASRGAFAASGCPWVLRLGFISVSWTVRDDPRRPAAASRCSGTRT